MMVRDIENIDLLIGLFRPQFESQTRPDPHSVMLLRDRTAPGLLIINGPLLRIVNIHRSY